VFDVTHEFTFAATKPSLTCLWATSR